MGGYAAGLGNGGGNVSGQLPLIPGTYDRFVLTRNPTTQDVTKIECYRESVLLLTVTLTYDAYENLIEVTQS